MAAIAKAAGVSQGAISSLLNDRRYGIRVSGATRERILRACRELGYVPHDLRAVVRIYPERGAFALLIAADIPPETPLVIELVQALVVRVPALLLGLYDPQTDYARQALP